MKKYKSVFKEGSQNNCLDFSSYKEYENFFESIGKVDKIDFDDALYEALVNNGLSKIEARTFLMERLTSDKVSRMYLYKDKLVVDVYNVEFGNDIEDSDNDENIASFTIIYYFKDKNWQWDSMY